MPSRRSRTTVKDNNYDKDADSKKMIKISLILVLSLVTNLLLFFNIAFQTLLPTSAVILTFLISPFICYLILRLKKNANPALYSFAFSPLVLNLLFLINYVFSFNPQKETYTLQRNSQTVFSKYTGHSSSQTTTEITLQNHAYEKYYGIRTFIDSENIKGWQITYTFKTGIFGIRVMTDYEF